MTNTSDSVWWDHLALVVDWITRIVGTLSFVAVSLLYLDVQNQQDCQAQFNERQAQRSSNLDGDLTRERVASRRVDDALAAIITAILQPIHPTPAESRALFTELSSALAAQSQARDAADRARAANPPVTEPVTRC